MRNKVIHQLLGSILMLQFFVSSGFAQQPSNVPNSQVQVPAPTKTVAPVLAGYIVNGHSALVNFVRERDGMGRITDSVQFAAAGYVDVKETMHYFDGLGRPLQTVQRQITPGGSPADVVTPVVYDAFGREVYKYLPYVASTGNTSDGSLKQDPFTDQNNFYQNVYPSQQPAYSGERVYYGQTVYEASPLNRVLMTMAPGNSWAGDSVGVSMQYLANGASDSVVIWNINSDTLTYVDNELGTNIPTSGGYYTAGQLAKNVTSDEQGHSVVEYKDKDGLIILKKVQIGGAAADFSGYSGWLSTYYVYDSRDQLRFVLSPKAVRVVYHNGWNISADTTSVNELCFRYEYDGRRRMSAKKVPGAGWVYMIFDKRDRLVFTQDANMRGHNEWLTTLYDGLDRANVTGMITFSGTPSQLQAYVNANTGNGTISQVDVSGASPSALQAGLDLSDPAENGDRQALDSITWENGFGTPDTVDFTAEIVAGTTTRTPFTDSLNIVDNALPPGNNFIGLTMTYYDDYANLPDKQYTTAYNSLLDPENNQHFEFLPSTVDNLAVQTNGLVTGTKVRVIENPNDLTQGQWLETANFYDDRARVVQTQSDNYKGGRDTLTTLYNFTNKPITTYLAHANPAATANNCTRIKTNMNLDAANRLLQRYKTINDLDSTKRLITQNVFDPMGQLMQKQIGEVSDGSFLETQDYTYNIRGWLKGINRDYADSDNSRGANDRWFGMELSYDWGFDSSQLNGNISGNRWRSKGDGRQRAYGFGYDDANRTLFADFNQFGTAWDKTAGVDFSSTMGNGTDPAAAYDENGNILAMKQMAWQVGGSNPIDRLNYNYSANSNKLKNVIDTVDDFQTTLGDFRTSALSPYHSGKTAGAIDYYYDGNGNLTRDLNKDIGTQSVDGIVYNHLNLPWQITVRGPSGTKGTITYIYDATGDKLMKTTSDTAGNLQTVTTYIGAFQYQGTRVLNSGAPSDTLQFIANEEGRMRAKTDTSGGHSSISFKYDYFLKDQLGNTRMVLTDEQKSDQYPMATMEITDSSLEKIYYTMLDDTRSSLPAGYPTDTTTNPNNYVAKLHVGSDNQPVIGPGMVLKVMAGDQFSVRVNSWYQLNGSSPQQPIYSPLTDVVAAMIAGLGHVQGESSLVSSLQSNNAPLSDNVVKFLRDTTGTYTIDEGKPKAFLNWILFDNQFNLVQASSGFQQVGTDGALTPIIMTNLAVNSSGYLYIYTSNATPNVDVFFDNLQVTHTRGPLLEEDHYYPFGLTMAGISDKAVMKFGAENKYLFNGKELQNQEFNDGSGLDLYDFGARMQDPQLGMWHNVDPLADKSLGNSVYAYANNNPIKYIDPNGMEIGTSYGNSDQDIANGLDVHRVFGSPLLMINHQVVDPENPDDIANIDDGPGKNTKSDGKPSDSKSKANQQEVDAIKVGNEIAKELPTDQAEKLKTILEKSDYLSLEFQVGERWVGEGSMVIRTTNGVLRVASTISKYNSLVKGLEGLGYFAAGLDLTINYYRYSQGEISGRRFAYRVVGTAATVASPFVYGAIIGGEAGPAGVLVGLGVGEIFYTGEQFHDKYTSDPKVKTHPSAEYPVLSLLSPGY